MQGFPTPVHDTPIDLLVLAAFAPELVGLRPHLGDDLYGTLRGLVIGARTVGVGMAVAGAGAAVRLLQAKPRAVLLLGSCGIYPCAVPYRPLDVVIPSQLRLFDPTVAAGKGDFPEPMQTILMPHAPISAGLMEAGNGRTRHASVATTLAITTDDQVAERVHPATGLEAENLELFPVAHACSMTGTPFAAVLGVTNLVGSAGRSDWRKYHRDAAIAAAEVVVTWVHNGAPGLPHHASTVAVP
jgi:nucleoside phosphorylase